MVSEDVRHELLRLCDEDAHGLTEHTEGHDCHLDQHDDENGEDDKQCDLDPTPRTAAGDRSRDSIGDDLIGGRPEMPFRRRRFWDTSRVPLITTMLYRTSLGTKVTLANPGDRVEMQFRQKIYIV